MNDHQTRGVIGFFKNNWPYGVVGVYFGFVMTRGEAVSWFRIQEMFRFQGVHMYGMIGAAVSTAAVAIWIIRKWDVKTLSGEDINIPPKDMGSGTRYWLGGSIFGLGWAMTGACPGPMFALVGNGIPVIFVSIAAAIAGTWVYGALRPRLPH